MPGWLLDPLYSCPVATPALILNPSSGAPGREPPHERLAEIFAAADAAPRVELALGGGEVIEKARQAVADGCDPIVAGGGDGTINAVASVVLGTSRTLGVLPMGTFNHFAKDLGIPLDLEEAAAVCLAGYATRVDVGEVNGRIFLNNSGLGLYPSVVRHRERQQEDFGRGKWNAFARALYAVLRRYPFLDVRLGIEGRELYRRTPFVFVGNNEYRMESFRLGGRPRLDAGQLCLYVAHKTGRLGLLRFAWNALFGNLDAQPDLDSLCAPEVRIDTRRRLLHVSADGEVEVMASPLLYRVLPGALNVLVPRPA